MLSKEEAYLKKVYDGTADASRLKINVTSEGSVPSMYTDGSSRYNTVYTTYRGWGNKIVYKMHISIDNTPITDWVDTMVITFQKTPSRGNAGSHHSNNNS